MNIGDFNIIIHSDKAITIELNEHQVYLDLSMSDEIIEVSKKNKMDGFEV